MLLHPLRFVSAGTVQMLFLNRRLLRESFRSTFNSGTGSASSDVLVGLALAAVDLSRFFAERVVLAPDGDCARIDTYRPDASMSGCVRHRYHRAEECGHEPVFLPISPFAAAGDLARAV